MKEFIKKIPIIFYFTLACSISWLSLLPIIGIDGFLGKTTLTDSQMPVLFLAMCTGPFIAGILSIYLIDCKNGFKTILSIEDLEAYCPACNCRLSGRYSARCS